jgi:hypothetical protein
MSELKTIETLDRNPFKYMVATIGNLPSSFVESMSYYECIAWLVKYLEKTVIPAVNGNAEALAELQAKFVELKNYVEHYFDNLDVQEEINNKLDDMAESGQLAEIIAIYVNAKSVIVFDDVASMKNAETLVDGSTALTLGRYSKNDGEPQLFSIREITNADVIDEMTILALTNSQTLVAEVVKDNTITPEMFGAKGDGVQDDTISFKAAINFAISRNLVFNANKAYLIKDSIQLDCDHQTINITGSILHQADEPFLSLIGNYNNILINKLVGTVGRSTNAIEMRSNHNRLNSCNNIKIGYISNFNKAIYLNGDEETSFGIQYNNFEGGYIKDCQYGIYFGISSNTPWINQNYFDRFRIDAIKGITIESTRDKNGINSNVFNEIGLESDARSMEIGIDNQNSRDNYFYNIRGSEVGENQFLVKEGNTCSHNIYEFTQYIKIGYVQITSGIITSPILSNENLILTFKGATFYEDGSYLLNDNEWKSTGRIYNAYNSDIDLTASNRKDVAWDMVYRFGADANGDYNIILNDANVHRSVVMVRIGNIPAGTFSMTVKDKDGNTLVPAGTINSTGLWSIIKESSNKWYAYKQTA